MDWEPTHIRPQTQWNHSIEARLADRDGMAGEYISGGIALQTITKGWYVDVLLIGRVTGYRNLVTGETIAHKGEILGIAIDSETIARYPSVSLPNHSR